MAVSYTHLDVYKRQSYYLTLEKEGSKGEGKIFSSKEEALMAYELGEIAINAKIKVRMYKEINGELRHGIIDTTVGKMCIRDRL